jgi:hypothetical protein
VILRFVLWNLADSKTTIQELRRYLRDESADAFADVPGLRFKAWISDEVTERWGAVYLWESAEAADQELPSHARERSGKDPDIGETFDVEATIEGRYVNEQLSRLVWRSNEAMNASPVARARIRSPTSSSRPARGDGWKHRRAETRLPSAPGRRTARDSRA